MQSFIRGQRAKISQLSNRTRRFEVLLTFCCGSIPVLDFVCFGTDAQNRLQDDRYMIFFNQKSSPESAIQLKELQDQDARFAIDLDALPPHIERLHFTASSEGTGRMSELAVSFVTLREVGVERADSVVSYRFSGNDFGTESSLLLAEIYKKDGEWRFTAVGQGFAGRLPALLKHFGGEEIEENASPTQSPTASPPTASPPTASPPTASPPTASPPTASPPTVSPPMVSLAPPPPSPPISSSQNAPLSPPISASNVSSPLLPATSRPQNALQRLVDATPRGGALQLSRGELQGPILIDKPLILEGAGAAIWAQNGPVVRVTSAGVSLRDVIIEATDPDEGPHGAKPHGAKPHGAKPHGAVALWVDEGIAANLEKVRVRGEIVGIAAASGEWKLPPALDLGEFGVRELNRFEFEIEVPCACELKTAIAGVALVPPRVGAGRSRLELQVAGIAHDVFVVGQVEVWAGGIGRTIAVHGRGVSGATVARGQRLWDIDSASDAA